MDTATNEVKLFDQEYEITEQKVVFSLYRSEKDGQVTVSLRYHFPMYSSEEVTCKRIFFPACAEYPHKYLSWYNLICCSNNYGPIPIVPYLNRSVQDEKKVAATIYPATTEEYMQILNEVEGSYYCFPYHVREYRYMLYISKKGTLGDYFDFQEIMDVYRKCGVSLDEEKMQHYFSQELNWFGIEDKCPIEIHNCLGDEELAVVGLLFGYPVESTIALIQKTIDMCEN